MGWQSLDDLVARLSYYHELRTACTAEAITAWLVGGCVRDLLLGRAPADIDVATEAPEPLARRFAGLTGARVVPMDPERGVWRVAIASGDFVDFCRFRDDGILGDLGGRDFTINAFALHVPVGAADPGGLFDPFRGVDDLNAGRLRMVAPRAFRDDPARILRAFRFLAELPMQLEDDTRRAIEADADRLPLAAPERLLAEWWKLCGGSRAAAAIARMDDAGALLALFPELQPMKGAGQNAYHRYDVWEHTLLAVTQMEEILRRPDDIFRDLLPEFSSLLDDAHRRARLIFLALLHDIGKPAARTVEAGKVHFYQHERIGAEMAGRTCRRLRASTEDMRAIDSVIRLHLRPLHLTHAWERGELSRHAMIKFFDESGEYLPEILALAMADKAAGQGPAAAPDVQERLRALYRTLFAFYHAHYLPALERPLLTGHDLLLELRLAPSPQIGRLLHRARDLQMQGTLTTREEALHWAKKAGDE